MKLRLSSSIFLLALTTTAFANPTLPTVVTPAKFYMGVFGGAGSSNKFNVSQQGTAFYAEALGGPLAVNAFGDLTSRSSSFFGGHLGYQAQALELGSSSQWAVAPAAELEGYYLDQTTFSGTVTNNTVRLTEHDFSVSYPMDRSVFLANAVVSFNNSCLPLQPYVGFGIGNAIVKISDATSTQTNPPEAGVNHYNANPTASNSTFAGQIKVGLNYNFSQHVSLFVDYRRLYLASTQFTFGSTVYTDHPETSSWQVNMNSQQYNLGTAGIRVSI